MRLDREKAQAPALVAELEQLSPARQLLIAHNSARFETPGVCELLTERLYEPRATSDVQVALQKGPTAKAPAERLLADSYGAAALPDLHAPGLERPGEQAKRPSSWPSLKSTFCPNVLRDPCQEPATRARSTSCLPSMVVLPWEPNR